MAAEDVLLVVADKASLTTEDIVVQGWITAMGFTDTLASDEDADASSGMAAVVIAESVVSGTVGTKYRDVTPGVMVLESLLTGEMEMASVDASFDTAIDEVDLIANTDPVAYGFTSSGLKTVNTGTISMHYNLDSQLPGDEVRVADTETNATHNVLWTFETGDTRDDGPATFDGRRAFIGFLSSTDGVSNASADARRFFEAALLWLMGGPQISPAARRAGSIRVNLDVSDERSDEVEFHASTTPSFTPSAGTLRVDGQNPNLATITWKVQGGIEYEVVLLYKKNGDSIESDRFLATAFHRRLLRKPARWS